MANSDKDSRTEEATPRRKQKERDQGNIVKSQDLNSALMITAGMALLGMMCGSMLNSFKDLATETFSNLKPWQINTQDIVVILYPCVSTMLKILLPFLISLMVIGIIIIRFQNGHVFAIEKLKPKLNGLSPENIMKALQRMFNPAELKSLVELVKAVIKISIVGLCGFSVLNGRKDELFGLLGANIDTGLAVIVSILSNMLINMCLAMLMIGFFDKKYQKYEFDKSIKMTKQEIKDEMKDTEGDPKIKSRIRSIQMQMAQQRMMSNVPTADVVVTNPTHYAVAIKYDKSKAPAPMVVAKGVDFIAFKIKEIAENNNVPIVENKPLARALYKLVRVDDIIPSDMFVAVAEVLAYVYNSKNPSK
ncbi:flagellar biosynthesis protein FlhB [bacterium]|nr:flagellar biosynthesis protein FlhB [bacterium]